AVAVAKAKLETAKANFSISQADRAKAEILSPIDGVVLARNVEVGQTVASSLQAPVLFTLAEDLAKMQLEVNIDEADVGSVVEGDSASFSVEAHQDRTFPAKIAQIRYSPATVEGVVAYKAILTVDNSELLLRPGMTATADITVQEIRDSLVVPNAALRYAPPATQTSRGGGAGLLGFLMPRPPSVQQPVQTTGGRSTVWVLRDGAPVAVSVKTGLSDGSHTAVTEGELTTDDKVIVGSKTSS
ncbi:MAG: efflux RND transporter periplasmic adaptor subunit, partial [Bauldia sp.]|nr:efflux RND transporter periplasmic adaptor subunit [Bauldia sp.]